MRMAPELVAGVFAVVVVLVGLVVQRSRARRTRTVGRPESRGPSNLRYTCAGCSQQFTHSRRTLGAWKKGTRQFYCSACHTRWRSARAAPPGSRVPQADGRGGSGPSGAPAGSGSGCLGVALLLAVVPLVIAVIVTQHA
jgi:hypothetical protein